MADGATPLLDEAAAPREKRVGICSLVVIGFFWVSGGIYGNEELISAAPPLIVVAFTVLMPLLFSLPSALMTAELATAFPSDGGQVAWVEMAFGASLGGHNAYWMWLANLFDAAVYPQMATQYLASALASRIDLSHTVQQIIRWSLVAAIALLNLLGVEWITASQGVIFAISITPCLLYIVLGLPHLEPANLIVSDGPVDAALLFSWTVWL